MKILEVTLKQHTPLIHFQHDQEGATLRASEVKPKLDRYILTKLGQGDYKKGIEEAKKNLWLVGKGEHPALNYKMRIKSTGNIQEYLIASYLSHDNKEKIEGSDIIIIDQSPFFAQEKEIGEIVKKHIDFNSIKYKGIISQYNVLEVFCSHDDLVDDILSKYIQSFFAFENFGTRQNKGFGCFTVEDIFIKGSEGDKRVDLKLIEQLFIENYSIRYKKRLSNNNLSSAFFTIANDYKLLKSGKNRPYAKSKLMLYGLKSGQRWEKKFFKEYIYENCKRENGEYYKLKSTNGRESKGLNENECYYFMRALLGVSNQYEFLLSNLTGKNNKIIVSVKSNDVERFKSPITFKVIDGIVYLLGNSIPPEILSKNFYFEVNIQGNSKIKDDRKDGVLKTPDRFDLKGFVDYAMTNKDKGGILKYEKF